jgi:glutamine amidotransferase
MWALRYPDARELFVLEREGGGDVLEAASASGRIRVQSEDLAAVRSVLFSSEPMDDDPGWRLLEPGEMVHVDADLSVRSRIALEDPPAHQLDLEDLDPRAAEAQRLGAELD